MPHYFVDDQDEVTHRVDAVASALDDLHRRLGSNTDQAPVLLETARVPGFLGQLCHWAVDTIPGAQMAGITAIGADGTVTTPACSDQRVVDVDADQYRTGQGPCLEAAATGVVVRVRIDELPERWPAFAAAVRGLGVRSYLSAPLRLDGDHVGALNLYGTDDHGFGELDVALLRIYTTFGAAVVGLSRDVGTALDEVAGLRTAMASRAVIEQAKGALMSSRGLSEDAFTVLVEVSQRENVKLAEIARRIVTSLGDRT
ncbi:ANTAR domain-containing protein [Rhodococcus sp. NPDC057014]|uniref:ANTAR domain-containing protein n=1 Tax=Rhodococcus sp. NPDC057014 TaxID=3346000 RepID=UPI0036407A49